MPRRLSFTLSSRRPGREGRVRRADEQGIGAAHLTLPSLRDGPLPLPPEGRRGAFLAQSPIGAHRINRREGQRERALPRRDIFIWAAAILFLNYLYGVVKEMPAASLEALVPDLLAVGIFQYLAWYVIFRLLGASDLAPAARLRDFLVTAALCLLVFLPSSRVIWVAASGIAIYLWLTDTGDPKLRAAGIVLAALSVQQLWGKVFFNLLAS